LSSRKEQREQARAEREAREAEERARAQRNRRMLQLGGALAAAVVIVVIAIAVSSGGSSKTGGSATGSAAGATQAQQLLNGIPQSGNVLGNPNAPVTLMEFADLQCPFCRQYTEQVFPTIVSKYVRTGKVKMVFRNYVFIGPDSLTAARAAEAAGQQNKLWNFIDVFYANQGSENTNYVSDKFIQKIAGAVPGLDVQKLMTDRGNPKVDQAISLTRQDASTRGINSTPAFLIQKGTGASQQLPSSVNFDVGAFSAALDKALAGK
jgi:protein-disulfide isomerase